MSPNGKSHLSSPIITTMRKRFDSTLGKLEESGLFVYNSEQDRHILVTWENLPQRIVLQIHPALLHNDGLSIRQIPGDGDTHVYGLIVDPEYHLMFGFTDGGELLGHGGHGCERR